MLDQKIHKYMIPAAIQAGWEIMQVYNQVEIQSTLKEDHSPLTLADQKAEQAILNILDSTHIPIISEEALNKPWEIRKSWEACWVVDPLDGTKEFLKRNDEFTVNIAYVEHGVPSLGIVFAPATGELFIGDTSFGAFKLVLPTPITYLYNVGGIEWNKQQLPFPPAKVRPYTVVASRSHLNQETEQFIGEAKQNYPDLTLLSRGSSLKLCMVAEGNADIYPRFAPTMEWDTAAGHAVALAAGCRVFDPTNKQPLSYNKEDLRNPWFIVERKPRI